MSHLYFIKKGEGPICDNGFANCRRWMIVASWVGQVAQAPLCFHARLWFLCQLRQVGDHCFMGWSTRPSFIIISWLFSMALPIAAGGGSLLHGLVKSPKHHYAFMTVYGFFANCRRLGIIASWVGQVAHAPLRFNGVSCGFFANCRRLGIIATWFGQVAEASF